MKPQIWSGQSISGSQKDIAPLMLELEIGSLGDVDTDMCLRKKILNEFSETFQE